MEYPERVWFVMSRNLSGEASEKEVEELLRIFKQQPHLMQQYELLKNFWNTQNHKESKIDPSRISHILQLSAVEVALNHGHKDQSSFHTRNQKRIYRWAAVFIGIFVLGLTSKWIISSNAERQHEIVAQKGSRTRTILPDGSKVWINAGSRIVYEPNFNAKEREVILYGEAYFDVVKEPARPFIVHAGSINIRVLGTVFNVKSYPDDKTIETTLLKGLVQITTTNPQQAAIYLHPSQKVILPQSISAGEAKPQSSMRNEGPGMSTNALGITNLDSNLKENELMETAWVYNRLEFRGDSFTELAKKLERWYNIIIHFEDEDVQKLTFNGSLENETIIQAFRALREANSFDFKFKNNEIFIRSTPGLSN